MKKTGIFFLLVLMIGVTPVLIYAAGKPAVNATAAILMDETGKVLYAKNANSMMAPASTTKIMTAIIGIEQGNLNTTVRVSKKAASKEGSSMRLKKNEYLTVKDLLYGLLLASGNDAATVIAQYIGGSEENFARMMTRKAGRLGMKNSQFKNPSGLPAHGHYTTAFDLALLTKYALQNPIFTQIVQTKEKTLIIGDKTVDLVNHNKLLWRYPYTTGVKTGYTVNAGRCLVASAKRKNTTLIAVVLKSSTMYSDCQKLFNYGFSSPKRKS